jgi:peptide-methionine (S)-S-oxide reductase
MKGSKNMKILRILLVFSIAITCASSAFAQSKLTKATFAGGCFWCMEPPFEKLSGVISVTSGYSGGEKKNPTYEEVSSGVTGHAESVQVLYDPSKITYLKLIEVYWHNVDPFVKDRQFCDTGNQYRTVIFYHDEAQKKIALESKASIEKMGRGEVYTQIVPFKEFYPAEEYHQDYYKKNPMQYKLYRTGCRRDARLQELWGMSSH